MDIFCRNVPDHLDKKRLKRAFKPILEELGIFTFECKKHTKGYATLTILDVQKARQLLEKYPKVPKGQRVAPNRLLMLFNTPIFIEEGRSKPDDLLLECLKAEEYQRQKRVLTSMTAGRPDDSQEKRRAFYIVSLSCGIFDYLDGTPIFREFYSLTERGVIKFGRTMLVVTIQNPSNPEMKYRLEFDYWSMYGTIYHGGYTTPSLVFTRTGAPRIYEVAERASITTTKDKEEKKRLGFLNDGHKHIVATCFTYRVLLRDATDIKLVHKLSNEHHIPLLDRWIDRRFTDSVPYAEQLGKFLVLLTAQTFPFRIKYQLQMLVWNGELPPST